LAVISLSDTELAAIMDAAKPIPAQHRSEFLRDVSAELSKFEVIGVGIVSRIAHRLQRQHLASRRSHGIGKWDR
jgi:hypothetical protein